MKIDFASPFADALTAWRRDGGTLLPIAGATMFLPQLAVLLLVPAIPALPPQGSDESVIAAWSQLAMAWAGHYGIWYVLAPALALLGALAVAGLYLDTRRPTVGEAMRRAALLFPRYVLASLLVALPAGTLLMPAMAAPMLLFGVLAPLFYIFARTMLIAPILVAQAPIGAVDSIARSWRMTAGNGWRLASIYAAIMLGAQMIGGVLLRIGAAAGTGRMENPVVTGLIDVMAAGVSAMAALLIILVEIAIYRRLARKGT